MTDSKFLCKDTALLTLNLYSHPYYDLETERARVHTNIAITSTEHEYNQP